MQKQKDKKGIVLAWQPYVVHLLMSFCDVTVHVWYANVHIWQANVHIWQTSVHIWHVPSYSFLAHFFSSWVDKFKTILHWAMKLVKAFQIWSHPPNMESCPPNTENHPPNMESHPPNMLTSNVTNQIEDHCEVRKSGKKIGKKKKTKLWWFHTSSYAISFYVTFSRVLTFQRTLHCTDFIGPSYGEL